MIRLAPGENFVKVTRALLTSDAWRAQNINTRRLIDFLMKEHLEKAGKANGKLRAPHRQLEASVISARLIAEAIRQADELGLVDCYRPGQRAANTYTLTWLPTHDGLEPSDRWRTYVAPKRLPSGARNTRADSATADRPHNGGQQDEKVRNLPAQVRVALPSDGRQDGRNRPSEVRADDLKAAQDLPADERALSRKLYQGVDEVLGKHERIGGSAGHRLLTPSAAKTLARVAW